MFILQSGFDILVTYLLVLSEWLMIVLSKKEVDQRPACMLYDASVV